MVGHALGDGPVFMGLCDGSCGGGDGRWGLVAWVRQSFAYAWNLLRFAENLDLK